MADFNGTAGADSITGTHDSESYDISQGGRDIIVALDGHDTILAGASFGAGDRIDGGVSQDLLDLDGDYSDGVVINTNRLIDVETIRVAAGHDYDFTIE